MADFKKFSNFAGKKFGGKPGWFKPNFGWGFNKWGEDEEMKKKPFPWKEEEDDKGGLMWMLGWKWEENEEEDKDEGKPESEWEEKDEHEMLEELVEKFDELLPLVDKVKEYLKK